MSFHRDKWIKATRKAHRCWWCGEMIPIGSPSCYQVNYCFDGDGIFTGYAHPECQAALDSRNWNDEWPDGIEEHAYSRGRADSDKLPPQFSPNYRGYKYPDRPKPISAPSDAKKEAIDAARKPDGEKL